MKMFKDLPFAASAWLLTALLPFTSTLAADGTQRIANGETVPECGWAPVMFIGNCTATLVHPKLVLYAAHCGTNGKSTLYFSDSSSGGRGVETERCEVNPEYNGSPSNDWAYCVLAEPVTDIPVIPVAFGCELDEIESGTPIVQCGFGASVGQSSGFGTKRWGANTVGNISAGQSSGSVTTSPHTVVGCPGDSGGPMLTQLKDGTWRTIGMASTLDTGYPSCGQDGAWNTYAWAPTSVAWIEEQSGIDITPCFDSDGTWNPTAECGGFFMGDHTPNGSWDNWCEGTPKSTMSSMCGAAFDEESPTVEIASPGDGDTFDGTSIEVTVDAKDNVEVAQVELFVDGTSVGTVDASPYTFEIKDLEPGDHELKASAQDTAKNASESATITIKVEDPSETTTTEDTSSSSTPSDDDDDDGDDDDDATSDAGDDDDDGDSTDTNTGETSEENGDDDDDADDDDDDATDAEEDPAPIQDTGCACNQSSATPFGALALLGLLGLRRRRR